MSMLSGKERVVDFLKKEKISAARFATKYVLEPCEGAEWLLIIFSGFTSEKNINQHPYNFISGLFGIPAHRLYIQDTFGKRGVYYLCENMDFGVREGVSELINEVQTKLGCGNDRTISIGSSKGGSAAAYFALKHGFAHALAMVPQFRIGTYVSYFNDVCEDMFGTSNLPEKIAYFDALIFDLLLQNENTILHIMTSENDGQYRPQIVPFVDFIKTHGLEDKHKVYINNHIKSHNDTARFNVDFVNQKLIQIIFGIHIEQTHEQIVIWREGSLAGREVYISRNSGQKQQHEISEEKTVLLCKEVFSFDIRVTAAGKLFYSYNFNEWTRESVSAIFFETEKNWIIKILNPESFILPLQYAFYIFDNTGNRLHVQWYSNNDTLYIPKEGKKAEKAVCFWKYEDIVFSKEIPVIPLFKKLEVKDLQHTINIENDVLTFSFSNLPECRNAEFAYYLIKNGQAVYKQFYTDKKYFERKLDEDGEYSVQFFVRQGDSVLLDKTKKITFRISSKNMPEITDNRNIQT